MTVDMSPGAVAARIREVARLSDLRRDRAPEGRADYSPAGIGRRLREVEQLRRLCETLGRAKPR